MTKAARAVWKARCEWVNEEETRVQKRNRWREAVRRVGVRLDLCNLTRKQAVDMANKKFAKVWKGMCKSMEEWEVEQGEMERKVNLEMQRIRKERGGPSGQHEEEMAEKRRCKQRTVSERTKGADTLRELEEGLARVRRLKLGLNTAGTPVGKWMEVRMEAWADRQDGVTA